jgi:oligopeptide/dipeptide ABC transporter ATP-binding protein
MSQIHTITASALSKHFVLKKGTFKKPEIFHALDNISFTLLEGETLGILGDAGAGKSTLANILVGAETASSGLLLIDNKDVTEVKSHQRLKSHRKVRLVYQNPYASLNPRLTIYKLLEEPLRNFTKLTKDECNDLIVKTLNLVGLREEHGRRLPHMFSAGERQRIAIARALILEPVCIVLDEPLSSLDISVQAQIINLMLELQKSLGLSYILITNNLPVIRHMCDQIMVLCRGQIVEFGPSSSILDNPKHPYTRDLLSKKSKVINSDQVQDAAFKGCIYSDRCSFTSEKCNTTKPVQQMFDDQLVYCHKVNEINSY